MLVSGAPQSTWPPLGCAADELAGLAEQAGFDYKSPRVLWRAHTRIPVLWEQKLPLAEAPVPVLFSFLLEVIHYE